MGAFLSSAASKDQQWEHGEAPRPDSSKSMRLSTPLCSHGHPRLIPGLPDEISLQILARMPRMGYLKAKMVSRSWKAAITSAELYRLRKELGVAEEWLYILMKTADDQKLVWHAFDPVSNQWQRLPLMPGISHSRVYGLGLGDLEVSPMSTGRAFCKTSLLNNKLYVVGGVSKGKNGLAPLKSAEVFDPATGVWADVPDMLFSKSQALPMSLADLLKPIATGVTSYRGKLYVPQSLYSWPFAVDVGGEIFDPETNSWEQMPTGMGEGWPARQAGTKLSVVIDGNLYALEPATSSGNAKIKMYDAQEDTWKVAVSKVPVGAFAESDSPYLLVGFLGKAPFDHQGCR
ncbi:unnamed protein product [Miscanthus lutarioriparius]|uniref:F-box domain-containing protein n=1 Tax=Miscanthus lutarioriparius TaxID=422564 RepID=A0A811R8N2_9POAL|nr:unnamed protein product [Miscanthus lutarioriparius]